MAMMSRDAGYDDEWYDIWAPPIATPSRAWAPEPPPEPVQRGQLNPPHNVPGGWQGDWGFIPASGAGEGSMGLAYWASRGVFPDEIFDSATGKLRPGWEHDQRGYRRAEAPKKVLDPFDPNSDYGDDGGGVFRGTVSDMAGWTVPSAPSFNSPRYKSPGAFSWQKPAPFQAPDKGAIYEDPGFVARMEQGQKAIENAASAKGQSRTGATWKGLIDYAERMASQEYGNVYGRRASEYDRAYRNAFEDAVTSYGFLVDDSQRQFTNDLAAETAEYAPSFETWRAQNQVDMFGRDLDLSRLGLVANLIETIYRGGIPTPPRPGG